MKEKAQQKKKIASVKTRADKKETDFEIFARIVLKNFEHVLKGQEEMRQELRQEMRQGQARLEQGQEEVKEEISSLKEEQKIQGRQITSIERKLGGTLLSIDETVHRSEFDGLVRRVEVLEK